MSSRARRRPTRSATQHAAVIFADLVGFTSLTEQLEDEELAALVSRFQSVAFDLVATGGGRVFKTLGDGVMVVCEDVNIGFRVATALANSYADEVNRPGFVGGSRAWKRGWSHGRRTDAGGADDASVLCAT